MAKRSEYQFRILVAFWIFMFGFRIARIRIEYLEHSSRFL